MKAMETETIDPEEEKAETASAVAEAAADLQRELFLPRLRLLRFGGDRHRRGVVERSGKCNEFPLSSA